MNLKKLIVAALTVGAFYNAQAQNLPLDPAVRTGKLPNGFTYYIRNNNEPQKRVMLYLVNKVGSVLEDNDQQGLAHFMEHMNFNGTKHFPKNELVDYLQKAGVRFGADLNAYTSFDETVYELPIPTDDPSMIGSGLKIMRDWAQDALLDSVEIEKERGVVLEEERLGKGASDRMARKFYPVMLNHSRYAERLPIGLDKILINFKPGVIRRFHNDWYRPDLQALIIVGDVNVNEVERIIRGEFTGLKNPANERTRTKYNVPLTGQKQFLTVTDKEATTTTLEILFKHIAPELQTEADYFSSLKVGLFNQLFAERRYAEISQEAKPAYNNMNASIQGLLGGLDMFAYSVDPKSGSIQEGFEQTWRYVQRVKQYGFSQAELDRAKQNYLLSMSNALKEKDKTPSENFVKEYQRLFLKDEASPGIQWEYDFVKSHIDNIQLADISGIMNDYLSAKDVDIIIMAPDKQKIALPDSAAVASWINNINKESIPPFEDVKVAQALMAVKPKPGKVIEKHFIPQLNVTTLTLSNGVKVILKPTDFKNDEIHFNALSPGGTSLYNDSDFDAAANAPSMISSFGIGKLSPVQLAEVLNGKTVNVSTNIGPRSETVSGSTTPTDLEAALQLAYLEFTQPRADTPIYNNTISTVKENLSNRYANPNNVFTDTVSYVMGDYAFRSSPPNIDRVNKLSLQKIYTIYKERFADASGFTFVFVGNFTPESITPLLLTYLGSLPSLYRNEQARDLGVHIPKGQLTKKVYKGTENKASVRLVISGGYQFGPYNNLLLKALSDVLQIKILQHLREDESEVYSPSVQVVNNKYPQGRYAFFVAFGCAPKNVDHLIEMVQKEMAALRDNGPQPDDVEKFKAAYQNNVELALKDNGFWINYLSSQYENKEDVLQLQQVNTDIDKITTQSVHQAAKQYLTGENMIRFELLPEISSTN
jgi:zinc protease